MGFFFQPVSLHNINDIPVDNAPTFQTVLHNDNFEYGMILTLNKPASMSYSG